MKGDSTVIHAKRLVLRRAGAAENGVGERRNRSPLHGKIPSLAKRLAGKKKG